MYKAAVITVSDRCAKGESIDESGPLIKEMLESAGYEVVISKILPDVQKEIEFSLKRIADECSASLIITTGGTGFAPRDVTPEATVAVCEKLAPGIPEAMRYASLQKTPRAILSRSQSGIRKRALIINLPGSPKAAKENLDAVLPSLEHGLTMLQGIQSDCADIKD